MGWFSGLFKKQPKNTRLAKTMNGLAPIYSQFGTDIYASDVVVQALACIAGEMKKLNPMHVRYVENDPVPVKGDLQDVLRNPNPLMTTSDFLEKITYLLLMNYNVFIVPTYYTWIDEKTGATRRYYKGLYPIQPSDVYFIEDATGELFVKFVFWDASETTIKYSDVIHIRYRYGVNEYMGGGYDGRPDHKGLLETLELNKQLLSGVAKAMKASYAVNGILKTNSVISDDETQAAIDNFEKKLQNSESGVLPLDMKADYTPITKDTKVVDEGTLKFIDEKILRYFGIPLPILLGTFTKEEYEAFFQKTLEGLIAAFSQAFTKKLLTEREQAFGNKIEFYPEQLIFMSTSQKIDMINLLSPTGALFENEKRTILGLMPLPELSGKRYMSLNWIDADKAAQYQVGQENVEVIDEEKEDI